MKKQIITDNAPKAIGPYSQGVSLCKLMLTSGQIPLNPATGSIPEGIGDQTVQALTNLKAVVEAGGSDMDNVLKVTVCLTDMDNFTEMNTIYSEFFKEPYPARTCFQVSRLPKDVLIEVEAIAAVK